MKEAGINRHLMLEVYNIHYGHVNNNHIKLLNIYILRGIQNTTGTLALKSQRYQPIRH